MANTGEILKMLIPNGGWQAVGDTYEGITFLECESITKEQFEQGKLNYDAWKAEQDAQATAKKAAAQAKLEALGLTVQDLAALGL